MTHLITAGTPLFHGTDNDDFEEGTDCLEGPAWLSDSAEVAAHFATNAGWGGTPRVIEYRLSEDITLPEVLSRHQLEVLAEEHALDLTSASAIRESIETSELPGWIVPYNYPEGADILIVNTNLLEYVETKNVPTTQPSPKG